MTAVTRAVDACVDLLLEDAATALALDFDLGLVLLRLVEKVDACLGQGIHWLN